MNNKIVDIALAELGPALGRIGAHIEKLGLTDEQKCEALVALGAILHQKGDAVYSLVGGQRLVDIFSAKSAGMMGVLCWEPNVSTP